MAGQAFADTAPAATDTPTSRVCDQRIRDGVSTQVNNYVDAQIAFNRQNLTPPPTLAQISNQPCMSKELGRISNQFSYAPSRYAQQLNSQILAAGGPVSGIMQKMFKSQFESITSAAASIGGMLKFQNLAQTALGGLMSSLGLGSAFSSELCGLMVDMLLKYVQCENPIKLPNLPDLFGGGINSLIPNNCAGNAARSALYQAGNMQSLQTLNQRVTVPQGGTFSTTPGSTTPGSTTPGGGSVDTLRP